jgi:hypothetical protein
MPESDPDDYLEVQQELLEVSLQLVFEAYDDACRRHVRDPVVFLLDCEDEVGGQIARSWLGDDAVDDAISEQHGGNAFPDCGKDEQTTVFAMAFPFKECRRELPAIFPYLSSALDQSPSQDGFYVISVAAGGASIFTSPHSARPE